jgi:hypothetical protein
MAETGWRCARADIGGHTGLSACLGSEELSLADPMEPPPSVVTGRGNGPKGTPGLLGLSRGSTARQFARRADRTHLLHTGGTCRCRKPM